MIRWAALLGLAGLALATALFVWRGAGAIFAAFFAAGFGILWSSAFHLVTMALNARAWRILLPRTLRPSTAFFLRAVWLREAVNGLLPVARIGGELASAQLLMSHGTRAPLAVASLVVDMTVSLVSLFVFAVLGLGLLSFAGGGGAFERRVALGLLAAVPILVALGLVQRLGFFGLLVRFARLMFGDRFQRLVGSAASLDRTVRRLYRRRAAILACLLWQLAGWIAGSGELYIALLFLGAPRSITDVLILESLIQAISATAFVVPGALGVQEGGFLVLGGILGLAPDIALALALMRRARDLLLFVPALVLWQVTLGRHLLAARGRGAPGGP